MNDDFLTSNRQAMSPPLPYSHPSEESEEVEEMIRNAPVVDVGEEKELILKYGAEHVIDTFKPVVYCMLIVVISLSWMPYYKIKDSYMLYTPFHEKTNDVGTKVWQSFANSAIVICVVIAITSLFVLLYKYNCMKIIMTWLVFTSVVLTFLFFGIHFEQIFYATNTPIDYITAAFIIYNYAILGLVVIHWKGPLMLQQAYLIMNSALFALTLIKYLPDWTTWVLLAFLSIWDLFAVLTPKGPLKALVDLAQERNDYFPSLIYSSTMIWTMVNTTTKSNGKRQNVSRLTNPMELNHSNSLSRREPSTPTSRPFSQRNSEIVDTLLVVDQARNPIDQIQTVVFRGSGARPAFLNGNNFGGDAPRNNVTASGGQSKPITIIPSNSPAPPKVINRWNPENEEDRGIKIGLGDLVFYSVLVGKASLRGDWITTISCFVATLIGLSLTLLLLALFNRPLPALPISICFGLIFYFTSSSVITPYLEALSEQNFFI